MNGRIIFAFVAVVGGVAAFSYGLALMSESIEKIVAKKGGAWIGRASKSTVGALSSGLAVSALTQSSTATSMTAVSLVSAGAISAASAAAIITGANVGTTVTAQIFARVGGGSGRAFTSALFMIFGVVFSSVERGKYKNFGDALFGLGLVLSGLDAVNGNISPFTELAAVRKTLRAEEPWLCFFCGIISTAAFQSSSAITGLTVVLCERGDASFFNAVFVVLGSNIGSCFAVIFASKRKSVEAKGAAAYNLVFNCLGALATFPIAFAFKSGFVELFTANVGTGKAVANFHTAFNVASAIAVLPFLKPITALCLRFASPKKRVKMRIKKVLR